MDNQMEIYTAQDATDSELMDFLRSRPGKALPAKIEADYDPLGLVGHERVYQAAAEQVYGVLSHIAETLASKDTDIRDALVEDHRVEFPKIRLDRWNVYGLRRTSDEDTGRVTYEFYRDDIGNPDGGFFVNRNNDGSVIVSRAELNGKPCNPEEDPGYPALIDAATKGAIVYATKMKIPIDGLSDKIDEEHLPDSRIAEFAKEMKIENSKTHKLLRGLGRVANTPVVLFNKAFMIVDPEARGIDDMENPPRVLSKKRLITAAAIAAVLMPVPGISPNMHTPASVEIVQDTFGAVGSIFAGGEDGPAPRDLVAEYDALALDLPSSSNLEVGSEPQSLPLLVGGVSQRILEDSPVIDAGEFGSDAVLTGSSPRQVRVRENIAPTECVRLPIDEAVQNQPYSFATTDATAAESLTVEAGLSAVTLCNTTEDPISSDYLSNFLFDVRS